MTITERLNSCTTKIVQYAPRVNIQENFQNRKIGNKTGVTGKLSWKNGKRNRYQRKFFELEKWSKKSMCKN